MAVSQIVIDISELEGQRLGYNGVSLNNWTDTLVDAYDAGSKFECGGAMYQVTADEVMGTVGEWGGIANSTLVYSYFDPSAIDFHFTSTAPTWSGSKQGWYGTGGAATYRYLASIYKDGSGNYTQKTILLSREHGITYQGICLINQSVNELHASILWDGTQYSINKDIDDVKSYYVDNTGAGTEIFSASLANGVGSTPVYLKKPVTGYYTGPGSLQIYQNGSWRDAVPYVFAVATYSIYLNPGYYRFYNNAVAGTQAYSFKCTGVFGATSITASEIIS